MYRFAYCVADVNNPCSRIMTLLSEGIAPRYTVTRFVAAGGMGCVFEGYDTHLKRRLALKALDADRASQEIRARFEREGRVQAQFSQSNIVRLYDTKETQNGLLVLLMEFVDGPTLQKTLEAGRLPATHVRRIGLQLLSALEHAHDRDVIHRDIKPSNIFMRDGDALLGDFGIASDPGDTTLTETGSRLGTILYMSPEQHDGEEADERSDLYSLGLVLRECATGRSPAHPEGFGDDAWVRVPKDLRKAIERAVKTDRSARWQSAREFSAELARTPAQRPQWWRVSSRWPPILVPVGLILLGLLYQTWPWGPEARPGTRPPAFDLAVLPFNGPDSGMTRDLTRMLQADLDWFAVLKLMPLAEAAAYVDSVPAAQRVKLPPDASHYLEGRLATSGTGIDIQIDLLTRGGQIEQRIRARGEAADFQYVTHALADSIVCRTWHSDCEVFRSIAFRPVDVQASREFFAGKDSVAKGHWAAGERHFRQALQVDPGFMPAMWELMITKRFQRKDHTAELTHIARNINTVPEFYRKLAVASLTPDLRLRFKLLGAAVDSSRQNGTALLMYANELFHRGALVGVPLGVTADTLRRMAATEPGMNHSSTYDMAWWADVRQGRAKEARDDLRRREALGLPPGDTYKAFQWLGFNARFAPWKADLMRWWMLRDLDDGTLALLHKYSRLATMMDVPNEQLQLGKILAARGLTTEQRGSAYIGMAEANLMFGRPSAAFALLDSADMQLESTELQLQMREWAIHLNTMGLLDDPARVTAARTWLASPGLRGSARVRALYALGRDALSTGDTVRADSILALFGTAPDTTPTAYRHALLLRGERMGRSDPEAALALTDVIYLRDTTTVRLSPFARAMTYLSRGQWQEALRQHQAADSAWLWHENADFEGWPMGMPQEGEIDAILSVYARLIRSEHAVKHQSYTVACRHLKRVRELWKETEPVMRTFRARADSAARVAECH